MDQLERNKRNAMAFYDLMFNQSKPREAMERFAGARYTQHNPHVGDGKEPFIAYFERMAREYPGKKVAPPASSSGWCETSSSTSPRWRS